jgi:hypothetical protein
MVLAVFSPADAAQDATTATQTSATTSDTTSTAASSAASTAASSAPTSAAPPSKSPVLQGGVNHAEALPSLDDSLQVGKVYSDDLLLKAGTQTNSEWFYIPSWYAGVRHAEDAMIVSRYDYESGKTTTPMLRQLNRQDALSGFQKDRNGGIWDFKRVPIIQHVESNFCNAVLYVKQITPITGSDDRIVIKYVEVSVSLDKRNNKILQIVQQEQINTISSPVPGSLRIDVSVKAFGWDGKPKTQEQSVMMSTIIKPFEQIDQYQGQDLRPLFRDYLVSHNLEKLIPLDLVQKSP